MLDLPLSYRHTDTWACVWGCVFRAHLEDVPLVPRFDENPAFYMLQGHDSEDGQGPSGRRRRQLLAHETKAQAALLASLTERVTNTVSDCGFWCVGVGVCLPLCSSRLS
jgi:hypothetical protein